MYQIIISLGLIGAIVYAKNEYEKYGFNDTHFGSIDESSLLISPLVILKIFLVLFLIVFFDFVLVIKLYNKCI
jgi:hypothetical protein